MAGRVGGVRVRKAEIRPLDVIGGAHSHHWLLPARSGLSPSDPDSGHPGGKVCSSTSCHMDRITPMPTAAAFPVLLFFLASGSCF